MEAPLLNSQQDPPKKRPDRPLWIGGVYRTPRKRESGPVWKEIPQSVGREAATKPDVRKPPTSKFPETKTENENVKDTKESPAAAVLKATCTSKPAAKSTGSSSDSDRDSDIDDAKPCAPKAAGKKRRKRGKRKKDKAPDHIPLPEKPQTCSEPAASSVLAASILDTSTSPVGNNITSTSKSNRPPPAAKMYNHASSQPDRKGADVNVSKNKATNSKATLIAVAKAKAEEAKAKLATEAKAKAEAEAKAKLAADAKTKADASRLFQLFSKRAPLEDDTPGTDINTVFQVARDRMEEEKELREKEARDRNRLLSNNPDELDRIPKRDSVLSKGPRSKSGSRGAVNEEYVRLYEASKALETDITSASDTARRNELRLQLRDAYVQIISLQPRFSLDKNVLNKLWFLYYQRIQDRLKKLRENDTEEYRQRSKLILDEAVAFFDKLCTEFETKVSSLEGSDNRNQFLPERTIVGRLLTCLGDLARYTEQLTDDVKDWSTAEQRYLRAIYYEPGHGKIHNQLAEIARQRDRVASNTDYSFEFEAVYRYTRSIYADIPFPAKESLLAICERNRQRLLGIDSQISGVSEHARFLLFPRFVRLYTILTTRISVETFDAALQSTLLLFQQHLLSGLLSSSTVYKFLVLSIAACEQCIAADSKRQAQLPSGTEPLTSLSLLTSKATELLLRLLGLVARWTVSRLAELPYLGCIAVACCWLLQDKYAYLILLGRSELTEFFKVGLAHLVNALYKEKLHGVFPGRLPEEEASMLFLRSLRGFSPLDACLRFKNETSDSSLGQTWQVDVVLEAGEDLLFFHENIQRFSAFSQPMESGINAQEHDELMRISRRINQKDIKKKKKKLKKGKKTVPLFPVRRNTPEAADSSTAADPPAEGADTSSDDANAVAPDALRSSEDEEVDQTGVTPSESLEDGVILFHSDLAEVGPGILNINISAYLHDRAHRIATEKKALDDARKQARLLERKEKQAKQNAFAHSNAETKSLILLDCPNICMRHGNNQAFSTQGLSLALNFYRQRGHKVIGILPESHLDYEFVAGKKRTAKQGIEVKKAAMPDSVSFLCSLRDEGVLYTTPAQDYDDSYVLAYALKHNACIVSNDKYRDYIDKLEVKDQPAMRKWLKQRLISFTFVNQEFLPNPDFLFPNE